MPKKRKENTLLSTLGFFCVILIFPLFISGIPLVHALDPPHDVTNLPQECYDCHLGHAAPGSELVKSSSNASLCLSCHKTSTPRAFGSWQSVDQAVPGTSGTSHRWDADAESAEHGAQMPDDSELASRIPDGKIMCSTCHNQHEGGSSGTVYVSPVEAMLSNSGNGTVSASTSGNDVTARHYLIEIIEPSPSATFRLSNDNGISWYGWDGGNWSPGFPDGKSVGPDVLLNDGPSVSVIFSDDTPGAFEIGDRFTFSVYRPMLRINNDYSELCIACHPDRDQSSAEQESGGDGVKVFSHPVGESLVRPYDRLEPLDANGALQSPGDGNETNDLKLGMDGTVHCMTCHQPHGADSNSLTEDPR